MLQVGADEIEPFAAIYFIDAAAPATAATPAAAIAAATFFACGRGLRCFALVRTTRFGFLTVAAFAASAAAAATALAVVAVGVGVG
jgi:hypothetical protein